MAKKKEMQKGYERLQELAGKARVELDKILRIIGKEANLSSKFLRRKIDILGLDSQIEKKYIDLGKEVYNLVSNGLITEPMLKSICNEIDKLYSKIEQGKKQIDKLKVQMKDVIPAKG